MTMAKLTLTGASRWRTNQISSSQWRWMCRITSTCSRGRERGRITRGEERGERRGEERRFGGVRSEEMRGGLQLYLQRGRKARQGTLGVFTQLHALLLVHE